jgi:hypothetical protein
VNNATPFTADRVTHMKIRMVALAASMAVCPAGIRVHVKPVGFGPLHRSTTGIVMAGS